MVKYNNKTNVRGINMSKMKNAKLKKILCASLASFMLLGSFTACGDGD